MLRISSQSKKIMKFESCYYFIKCDDDDVDEELYDVIKMTSIYDQKIIVFSKKK